MPTPSFAMSADTRFIRQELDKIAPGVMITYTDLAALTGIPITGAFPALTSARNSLVRDQVVFSTIRGVGLKRLSDEEIVTASNQDIQAIRRRSRRAIKKLVSVQDFSKLPAKAQLDHTIKLSVLGVVSEMTTERVMKKLVAPATGRSSELSFRDTISAFL